jgi:signal transduction histidine kinase
VTLADPREWRVLVLAPTARDASLTRTILANAAISCLVCGNALELVRALQDGAGAVLIAEEQLDDASVRELALVLEHAPPWSDLPLLVLTQRGADSPAVSRAVAALGNVTLLERPTRVGALVSAVQSALRARARQYQIRAHLADREAVSERLIESDRKKDEFLAVLAHELRNPLAPIHNSIQILKLQRGNEQIDFVCDVMERQVAHMVRLVDDLLEVSRITRGQIELRRETVELGAVVMTAVEACRPLIEERRHRLTIALPGEPVTFEGDAVRLAQVLENLLNNAAKYTDPSGIIRISARRRGDELVIRVRDTGIGIAREAQPRIFEMFTRIHRVSGETHGGLGIGLALVRQLVEMHGGSVKVRSRGEGHGSRFYVRLPMRQRLISASAEDARSAGDIGIAHRRILVVDDHRDGAHVLAALLAELGADVTVASDGESALTAVDDHHPDAVILDLGMPGMDGYEVARRIRARPELSDIRLIALTGWGQASDRRGTAAAGFDHHFTKPANIEELRAALAI